MKQQNVTQMQKDVRAILEESVNSSDLEGVSDVGTISINEVIKSVLTKAVTAVANVAPMELFISPSYKLYSVTPAPVATYQHAKTSSAGQEIVIPFAFNGYTIEDLDLEHVDDSTIASYVLSESAKELRVTINANVSAETQNKWLTLPWNLEDGSTFSQTITIEQTTNATGDVELSEPVQPAEALGNFTRYNGSYILKPNDYLRFLYIQGDSWMRPVTTLTPMSSPFASIARSDVNMSVGNVDKPLVVDSFVGGKGALEIYPSPDETVDFVYVERPAITTVSTVDYINCDDGIYHAAVLYAAYLVAMIKGYNNADQYKNAALESITQQQVPTNPTAGAETQK